MWFRGEQFVPNAMGEKPHRNMPERLEEEVAGLCLRYLERLHRNGAERATEPFDLGGVLHTMGNRLKACTFTPTWRRTTSMSTARMVHCSRSMPTISYKLGRPSGFASSAAAVPT